MWLRSILAPRRAPGDPDRFAVLRRRMVQQAGPARGITHPRVLAALERVPRHEFVPVELRADAYDDAALQIGFGQTISQPFVVAVMTCQLDPQPADRVLEVGTGSGYQSAVLSGLVQEVYSIEILEPLAEWAAANLARLGCTNVHLRVGDGYQGWPDAAPFDGIIVACAPERVPAPLIEQLKDGGRMIIPVGGLDDQNLVLLHKRGGKLEQCAVLPVRFVPMTGDVERDR